MFKQRLLKLADGLEKQIPNKKFNLRTYAEVKTMEILNFTKNPECITTACAIGSAPFIFKRADWKLEQQANYWGSPYNQLECVYTDRQGNRYINLEGAMKFFGITEIQAEWLFMPDKYGKTRRTKRHVVQRIRNFVASGGKVPSNIAEISHE